MDRIEVALPRGYHSLPELSQELYLDKVSEEMCDILMSDENRSLGVVCIARRTTNNEYFLGAEFKSTRDPNVINDIMNKVLADNQPTALMDPILGYNDNIAVMDIAADVLHDRIDALVDVYDISEQRLLISSEIDECIVMDPSDNDIDIANALDIGDLYHLACVTRIQKVLPGGSVTLTIFVISGMDRHNDINKPYHFVCAKTETEDERTAFNRFVSRNNLSEAIPYSYVNERCNIADVMSMCAVFS